MDGRLRPPLCPRAPSLLWRGRDPGLGHDPLFVTIMRGLLSAGCTFCSITEHERPHIQNPLGSLRGARDRNHPRQDQGASPAHLRHGGPTANMYRMACKDKKSRRCAAGRPASIPAFAPTSTPARRADLALSQGARGARVKKVLVASGCATTSRWKAPPMCGELVTHHVGGSSRSRRSTPRKAPLAKMMKPGHRQL